MRERLYIITSNGKCVRRHWKEKEGIANTDLYCSLDEANAAVNLMNDTNNCSDNTEIKPITIEIDEDTLSFIKSGFSVENIIGRNGDAVKNQFVVTIGDYVIFQSYKSTIAVYNKITRILVVGKHWDYSVTTSKYLKLFIDSYVRNGITYESRDKFRKLLGSGSKSISYDGDLV
ncbi:MAG: hypothetical protein RR420_01080 [Anaerovoracaceae bacterium]